MKLIIALVAVEQLSIHEFCGCDRVLITHGTEMFAFFGAAETC